MIVAPRVAWTLDRADLQLVGRVITRTMDRCGEVVRELSRLDADAAKAVATLHAELERLTTSLGRAVMDADAATLAPTTP